MRVSDRGDHHNMGDDLIGLAPLVFWVILTKSSAMMPQDHSLV